MMKPYIDSTLEIRTNENRVNQSLSIVIVILMSLVPIVQSSLQYAGVIIIAIITLLSWRRSSFHLGVFGSICLAIMVTRIPYSQILFALAIGLYLLIIFVVPDLKAGFSWFRLGTFTRDIKILCVGIATVSGLAVTGWFLWFRPNIVDIVQHYVPDYPLWLLISGGTLFAVVNAAVEEVAYRGIVLGALIHSAVPTGLALLLQGLAFGAIHINGFPRGWIGVSLATIYGVLMGTLRIWSKGLFAPWAGHVLTDLVIAAIVIAVARLS